MEWLVIGISVAMLVSGLIGIFAATSAEARDRANRKRGLLTDGERRQIERIKRRRAEMGARDK